MDFKDITEEQAAKISKCSCPEDVLELAKQEGYELSDEEIEQIAGGSGWEHGRCPICGSYCRLHRATGAKCLNCGYDETF